MVNTDVIKPLIRYGDTIITQDDINQLCNEYIDSLPVPDMVLKSNCFTGMLNYIYRSVLKPIIDKSRISPTGKVYRYDYGLLDNIFDYIYLPLCYKYNITPTVIGFTSLVNISKENITDIRNGRYRHDGSKVNHNTTLIIQKWFDTCESSVIGKIVNENSIGNMFYAKSFYGYSEQQTIRIESGNEQLDSIEQIALRHNTALIPEKPVLEHAE